MRDLRPIAVPRLAQPNGDVDVVIVGAGAAGIAAARQCRDLGLTCTVLEARDWVGGRCITAAIDGYRVDLGAHWLHAGEVNPLVALGRASGEPLSRSSISGQLVVRGNFADGATMSGHRAAFDRAAEAIAAVLEGEGDASIAEVLPDLGRWTLPVSSTLALISGRPLDEVSARDFPGEEFGDNWFVRGGYGAFLSRLADDLPVGLGHAVTEIDWSGQGVTAKGAFGTVTARAVLVTLPIPILSAGGIRFTPSLPDRTQEALHAFLPGTYEHVILDWPDSPFEGADQLTKIMDETMSYGLMSRMDDNAIHYLEIDHATVESHGRDGDRIAAFAKAWLTEQLGADAVRTLAVRHVTDWTGDPLSGCAWAVATPGRSADRSILSDAVGERIWIAGEATSPRMWGTVGGAWDEGIRAVTEIAGQVTMR